MKLSDHQALVMEQIKAGNTDGEVFTRVFTGKRNKKDGSQSVFNRNTIESLAAMGMLEFVPNQGYRLSKY